MLNWLITAIQMDGTRSVLAQIVRPDIRSHLEFVNLNNFACKMTISLRFSSRVMQELNILIAETPVEVIPILHLQVKLLTARNVQF